MDVERTIEFILQQHARTEAMMQRLEESQKRSEENQLRLDESQLRLGESQLRLGENQLRLGENLRNSWEAIDALTEGLTGLTRNLGTVTDLVRELSEQNQQEHGRFEEFHRGVDQRFDILIKMMDEWIRTQRNQNGRS